MRSLAKCLVLLCAADFVRGYSVLTLAGDGIVGTDDGIGLSSRFSAPRGLSFDLSGNLIVVDTGNHRIRKISLWDRSVTTFVGSSQGFSDGNNPTFNGLTSSTSQDLLGIHVTDHFNQRIRRINSTGFALTVAGTGTIGSLNGAGATATFKYPYALCFDNFTGDLFVSDYSLVRRITPAGIVSTFATVGGYQTGITVDNASNVYVADNAMNRVNKISPGGIVTVFAGSGTAGFFDAQGANAMFRGPHSIALDAFQNLMVVERYNHAVRQISPSGVVTTIGGSGTSGYADGLGVNAVFNNPEGVAVDQNGNIYVGDTGGNRIRMIVPCDGGFFVQNATCQTCPAGTYSLFAQFGNNSCIPCVAGNFSAAGSASCSSSCASGFAAGAGSAACFPIRSTTIAAAPRATTLLPSSTLPSDVISSISSLWTTTSNRESVNIQTTVTTIMPKVTPSSASLRLENGSSGIDSRIVIYASASVGAAALVSTTVFLLQRRRKVKNSRLKPVHNTAANELNSRFSEFSGNLHTGQSNESYNPMNGFDNRRTGGNQSPGPLLRQSLPSSGWTASSYGSVGDSPNRNFASRSFTAATQFGHLPNLVNATLFNRGQTLAFPGTMNVGGTSNFSRTIQGSSGMTTIANTRITGNTVTLMPRSTMQFEKIEINSPEL